jgi:hypothetical protein
MRGALLTLSCVAFSTLSACSVHADHLFYDSLVSEEPQLLFQPHANANANADTDADGQVTKAELSVAEISG